MTNLTGFCKLLRSLDSIKGAVGLHHGNSKIRMLEDRQNKWISHVDNTVLSKNKAKNIASVLRKITV